VDIRSILKHVKQFPEHAPKCGRVFFVCPLPTAGSQRNIAPIFRGKAELLREWLYKE
jgi:hypothetical protein